MLQSGVWLPVSIALHAVPSTAAAIQLAPPSKLSCGLSSDVSASESAPDTVRSASPLAVNKVAGRAGIVGHGGDGDSRGRRRLIEHIGLREGSADYAAGVLDARDQRAASRQGDGERKRGGSRCGVGGQPRCAAAERQLHCIACCKCSAQRAGDGLGGGVGDEIGAARSRVGRDREQADIDVVLATSPTRAAARRGRSRPIVLGGEIGCRCILDIAMPVEPWRRVGWVVIVSIKIVCLAGALLVEQFGERPPVTDVPSPNTMEKLSG